MRPSQRPTELKIKIKSSNAIARAVVANARLANAVKKGLML
jgi:hypothetical protein